MIRKPKKVLVAMSGGVDSSVAAALLKREGFDVIGVFMKLADLSSFREGEKRAKKVAQILKIPLLSLDCKKKFKKEIINYFLREQKSGLTPNPCVVCNKKIKFGLLLKKAHGLGADYLATGHYVRKQETRNSKKKIEYKLLTGKDKEKDQSYFLWQLNQNQLKRILFPVGNHTKTEVKKLAKKFNLPVFNILESQEICFIPTKANEFLVKNVKPKPGKIITKEGKIIGRHQGLCFYTIGQRRGIKLSGGPFYVLDKDLKKNNLIVTKNKKDLYKKELSAKNINWISGKEPKLPLKIKAKIRYRHQPVIATITSRAKSKTYSVEFKKEQRAITPGQSLVFYMGQELLGGGIICLYEKIN